MEFEHNKSWNRFQEIIATKQSAGNSWKELIDFLRKEDESIFWETLYIYDFENDKAEITEWLEQLLTEDPPTEDIVALWLGIIKFLHEDKKEMYAIYLVGANSFNPENIEWAVEPTYLPRNRYFAPDILNSVYTNIKPLDSDISGFLDWILPLAYSSFIVNDIIRTQLNKTRLPITLEKLHVYCGFDDGDFQELESISKTQTN